MRNENYLKIGVAAVILILGVTISCSRNFAVPVSPTLTTSTPTVTNASTNTPTNTSTNTVTGPTSTFTNTATVTPTSTATNTATTTATNTATTLGANTFTATNTPTTTATHTATNTATATATNTPLATVYPLIDDFEGTGAGGGDSITGIYNATDQNGVLRNGGLFAYMDLSGLTNITLASSSTAEQGSASLETSGFVSSSSNANFAGWGFDFLSPVAAYDATVTNRYIGISFYVQAKSMAVSNCEGVQAINAILTDSVPVTASIAFPVTQGGWTPVTLFFNQFLSSTGALITPSKLTQMQFQILDNGFTGANNNFDILWDNVQLVAAGAPGAPAAAATPLPANIVSNFTNGTNQVQYVPPSGTSGYFYNYIGSAAGDSMCPLAGAVFDAAPGHLAQVIPGVPSFAAHYSGTSNDYSGYGWGFAQNNVATNISAYTQLVFWVKSASSNTFTLDFQDTENVGCYGASTNTVSVPTTAAWAAVTITFSSIPSVSIAGPNPGPAVNGCTGTTNYASEPYDTTQATQIAFEPPSGAFDLWLDDIYMQ